MDGVVGVAWGSRERGIIVNIDVLSHRPYDIKPMFKGFNNRVLCSLLGSRGDVGFGVMMYML